MKLVTCTFLLLVSTYWAQSQPVITIFHTFPKTQNGHYPQGIDPRQPIEGAGENLIGITNVGGNVGGDCASDFGSNLGCGTVYLLNSNGKRKGLFDFPYDPQSGNYYPYGAYPFGTLVQGRDSQFYGVTQGGTRHKGFGTIFKVNASGQLRTLHVFCQQTGCTDGAAPHGSLIRGTDGYFYGTTIGKATGGAVIYRISPGGAFQIVRTLPRHGPNGVLPIGNLLQASDGNFYGYSATASGAGKIFRLTPPGKVTIFYQFGSVPLDGAGPSGSLIQALDGNLYGATGAGGTNGNGTIFRISLSGNYSKVFDFQFGVSGNNPSEPMQASDGNFWGTTLLGNIYAITPTGTLLQSIFTQCPLGVPSGYAFTQAVNGKLYTPFLECQGPSQGGAIIEVDAGLPPPMPSLAAFTPSSGPAGTTVVLSGAHFVSASSVTFNGTPAAFVVNASGVVSATVPNGASSGPIQITVPGGTATSSSSFTVTP